MLGVRLLPWEYGVRNLLRRPGRSLLTLAGLALVVLLIFVVVGFIRGLEASLDVSGDPRVLFVHSAGASGNVEESSIKNSTLGLLTSLKSVERTTGPAGEPIVFASPEVYLGSDVSVAGGEPTLGVVRGVTPTAVYVRRRVQIVEGQWPGPGDVLVGRLAAAKLGYRADTLRVGAEIVFEGRPWRVSGRFAAAGSALESELWCPLDDLHRAMRRDDKSLSLVALLIKPDADFSEVQYLCAKRRTLELAATPETEYYESLRKHYGPVRALSWTIVFLVAGAGVFAGLNTMYGAVVGRVRELSTLQALGFRRRAIVLALVQEAALLAAAGALLAALIALWFVNGLAVRFTMSAFTLRIDGPAVLIACGTGLLLGVVGALPPALRALRMPVVEGLKAV